MNKLFFKSIIPALLLILLAQLLTPIPAFAQDWVSIRLNSAKGDQLQDRLLLKGENIYPGWSTKKTVYIKNKSTNQDTKLYFSLELEGNKKLAKELKLSITKLGADKKVLIGGPQDRYNLASASQKELFLDRLAPASSQRYEIKIKLNPNVGNQFQHLSTKFKLALTVKAAIDPDQTSTTDLTSNNQGYPIPDQNLNQQQPEAAVLGDKTPLISQQGITTENNAATKSKNHKTSLWLIILVILLTVLYFNLWKRAKGEKYSLKFNVFAVVLLIVGWYLLEKYQLLPNYWL